MRVVIHKEGFTIEAFTFFIEIVKKTKREFFSVFKLKIKEELKVKVKKKARDEEGGKNQKTTKATMYK